MIQQYKNSKLKATKINRAVADLSQIAVADRGDPSRLKLRFSNHRRSSYSCRIVINQLSKVALFKTSFSF
jgi:hypothetical protein